MIMNKQEVIEKIENEIPDFILNDYHRGRETGLTYALELVNQLDEPEKPIVPQFVADWYEANKEDFEFNLYSLCVEFHEWGLGGEIGSWFSKTSNKSIEILVLMHQFGYEVEKEKLYTAKLKSTGEYLHYDKDYRETRHQRVPDDVAQKCEGYHFTEDELIKYHAWENDAYEIEEVEE